jgi:O-antigen/teichoic acid export membrane protein
MELSEQTSRSCLQERAQLRDPFSPSKIKTALQTYTWFKLVNFVLAFAFQVLVVKTLQPGQYATYAVLLAFLTTGERLLSFGLDRATMKFVPTLTQRRDSKHLRGAIVRICSMRLVALFVFAAICVLMLENLDRFLPAIDRGTVVAFVIWFVSFTLMTDADAFAQSWLAHSDSAVAQFLEVCARMLATIAAASLSVGGVSAGTIVTISATTSTLSAIYLLMRLSRFRSILKGSAPGVDTSSADARFDPRGIPWFALANYASTIVFLVSSPPMIRIVASAGLGVVSLAAFSFIQTLATSAQRLLPGLLILPMLEPIIMSGILVRGKGEGMISGLSLLFKLEISCILCGIIIATIAGEDLIIVFSRRDYSNYSDVLIVMLIYVAFATAYRLLEMIINTNSKQTIFLVIWPISCISVITTYVLVQRIGLIAVLLIPTLEIALRVMLLATAFRQYGTFRVFDPLRTLPLILAATTIAIAGRIALRLFGADHSMLLDFALAAVAALLFLGGVCICKILRPPEYEVLGAVFPERWRPAFSFILNGARS